MWTLINYFDVWGNAKDGWDVNNLCSEGTVEGLAQDAKDAEVLRALKDKGFFRKHVRLNMLEIEEPGFDMIQINQRRDGLPLCRLEWKDAYPNTRKAGTDEATI